MDSFFETAPPEGEVSTVDAPTVSIDTAAAPPPTTGEDVPTWGDTTPKAEPKPAGTPTWGDVGVEGTAPPDASPPSALEQQVADLEKRVAEADRKAEEADRRQRDTHGNWNAEHMARISAQTVIDTLRGQQAQEAQQQQMAQQLAPPEITDPDELVVDGSRMVKALRDHADWNLQRVQAAFGPTAQQAATMARVMLPVIQSQASIARDHGRTLAESHGITPEQFDSVAGVVETAFARQSDYEQAIQLRLNPEAYVEATRLALSQNGQSAQPVKNPSKPPPVSPSSRPGAGKSAAKPQAVKLFEERLGIQFGKDSLAEFTENTQRGR